MMLLLFYIGQNFQDSGNGQDRNQPKVFEPTIYHKNGRVTCPLECPMLWRITKHSLHNEGIYKWESSTPIFFWKQLLQTTYGSQQFAKIRVFIVDNFVLLIFLLPKLRSVAHIEWKKYSYIFFSTLGSKINEFGRKKSEKN